MASYASVFLFSNLKDHIDINYQQQKRPSWFFGNCLYELSFYYLRLLMLSVFLICCLTNKSHQISNVTVMLDETSAISATKCGMQFIHVKILSSQVK
ncbi:hypothetical protein GYH30_045679 [Glycine max]|uniref:Uncharacterized protein n=1 Tax=Glycine max TaxID=3847 RepID=K7MIW8_SOYBN|nr:hypothetical protein GYH30_045679 [Glycine max]